MKEPNGNRNTRLSKPTKSNERSPVLSEEETGSDSLRDNKQPSSDLEPKLEKEALEEPLLAKKSSKRQSSTEKIGDGEKTPEPMFETFSISNESSAGEIEEKIKDIVNRQVRSIIERWSGLASKYEILILHETRLMTRFSADRVYRELRSASGKNRPILLIINSPGGVPSAAYFIAKLCRQHVSTSFDVAIPRRAKSAATLLCCGADRLHMGALSELGPIDPQLHGIPLLALRHSVEHIAQLASSNPGASRMFSDYLASALRIDSIGYFERVAESSMHYAIQLLKTRVAMKDPCIHEDVAKRLVYGYKDHGFVIDVDEATDIFGSERCQRDTEEYRLSNEIYEAFELIQLIASTNLGFDFSYIGRPAASSPCWVFKTSGEDG